MGKSADGQLDSIKSDGRFIVCFGPKWSARKNLKNQAGVLSLFYRVFVRVGRLIDSRLCKVGRRVSLYNESKCAMCLFYRVFVSLTREKIERKVFWTTYSQ
jgi:hypothetical protein